MSLEVILKNLHKISVNVTETRCNDPMTEKITLYDQFVNPNPPIILQLLCVDHYEEIS